MRIERDHTIQIDQDDEGGPRFTLPCHLDVDENRAEATLRDWIRQSRDLDELADNAGDVIPEVIEAAFPDATVDRFR